MGNETRATGASPSARLVIVDDHELARAGLRSMLIGEEGLEVVGEASNGREAVALCRDLRPDLVLMDVRMPEMDGLTATRAIKAECPQTSVLIVTMNENPDYLFEALKAGAAGYILKDATHRELITSVRQVLHGEALLNRKVVSQLLNRLASGGHDRSRANADKLSPREVEVIRLVARGKSNREIAVALVVSPSTVKAHVENIMAKLEVSDRTHAAVRAIEFGLITPTADQS
jgi:DNA-binding NarL/FixJ family response regulator